MITNNPHFGQVAKRKKNARMKKTVENGLYFSHVISHERILRINGGKIRTILQRK